MPLLLWIHTISTLSMFLIIIIVQIVIYPQFTEVGKKELKRYSTLHMKRISYIVVPIMLIEMGSLLYLLSQIPIYNIYLWLCILSLALIWVLTFFKIVPVHQQIATQAKQELIPKLIQLNLYRTLLWTIKACASIGLLTH
jgi:hypothetical protein